MTDQVDHALSRKGNGRFWWQSFAAKMALSTSALLLFVILITSAFSYNALRDMSLRVANQSLESHASTLRHDMQERVSSMVVNLQELSSNALIANALTDDLGREVYLRGFLSGLTTSEGFEIALVMTNFLGRPTAANRSDATLMMPASQVAELIERRASGGQIVVEGDTPYLVLVEPIIFRNTGTAEGALVLQVNLNDWVGFESIQRFINDEDWISALNLVVIDPQASTGQHIGQPDNVYIPHIVHEIVFPENVTGARLAVELTADEQFVQAPLDELLVNVSELGVAVFLVTIFGTIILSKTQTRKLNRLMEEAGQISKVKFEDISFTSDGRDEVDDLADAFTVLVDQLQQAYRKLEDESQREIEQRELRFQSIINNSAEGIITLSREGIIETFNPSAEGIFGYSEGEVLGKNISILMPKEERPAHDQYLRHSQLHAPKIINRSRDLFGLRKNGLLFPLELNVSPMELNGEQKFIGIMRDISERKEFEERINTARVEAEQANLAKSQFLSSMSHELRTPLNAVLGFGQLLELDSEHPLSESQLRSVRQILKGGNHLLELIDQVLNLAKIESGKMALSRESIDVTPQLMDALAMAKTLADQRHISITYDIPKPGTTFVLADVTRLHQILLNLLSNATKYNFEGGSLSLTCKVIDDVCRFEVKDSGPGIPRHLHDKVFAPFNRLGAEGSTIEGTGIGLTITRELVNLMHGRIGFESEQGKGALFWFDLPLSSRPSLSGSGHNVRAKKPSDERGQTQVSEHRVKVLYVEDNPSNVQLMRMILEHDERLEMISAKSAENGIEMAIARQPSLVLMDLQLPGMNGIEAMRILRQNPKTADIPVIAVSANAMEKDIQNALDAGFDHYLTKPLDIRKTLQAITDAVF